MNRLRLHSGFAADVRDKIPYPFVTHTSRSFIVQTFKAEKVCLRFFSGAKIALYIFFLLMGQSESFLLAHENLENSVLAESRAEEKYSDLTHLTLEDLMAVEIVSLGQKQPTLFENTSVVYVITQEDIRRSEVTSIPEALRMVPGVQVDRLSDQQWAIKIQGLLDRLVNTLLVMIDGCLVSKSLLTGTTWDMRDTMLEDIERIEVSRESAETSRGVNAINGVIHIFTTHGRNNQEF